MLFLKPGTRKFGWIMIIRILQKKRKATSFLFFANLATKFYFLLFSTCPLVLQLFHCSYEGKAVSLENGCLCSQNYDTSEMAGDSKGHLLQLPIQGKWSFYPHILAKYPKDGTFSTYYSSPLHLYMTLLESLYSVNWSLFHYYIYLVVSLQVMKNKSNPSFIWNPLSI